MGARSAETGEETLRRSPWQRHPSAARCRGASRAYPTVREPVARAFERAWIGRSAKKICTCAHRARQKTADGAPIAAPRVRAGSAQDCDSPQSPRGCEVSGRRAHDALGARAHAETTPRAPRTDSRGRSARVLRASRVHFPLHSVRQAPILLKTGAQGLRIHAKVRSPQSWQSGRRRPRRAPRRRPRRPAARSSSLLRTFVL